jgi:hypothetical protein
MSHRPETLMAFRLAIALRRGTKTKPGLKWSAVANFLNMTESALKKMLARVSRDRRKDSRPNLKDRRNNCPQNVPIMSPSEKTNIA